MNDRKLLNRFDNIEGLDERTRAAISAVTDDGRHEDRRQIKMEAMETLRLYIDRFAEVCSSDNVDNDKEKSMRKFTEVGEIFSAHLAERLVRKARMKAYSESQIGSTAARKASQDRKAGNYSLALELADELCQGEKRDAVWTRFQLAKAVYQNWISLSDNDSNKVPRPNTIRRYLDEAEYCHPSLRLRKSKKPKPQAPETEKFSWADIS